MARCELIRQIMDAVERHVFLVIRSRGERGPYRSQCREISRYDGSRGEIPRGIEAVACDVDGDARRRGGRVDLAEHDALAGRVQHWKSLGEVVADPQRVGEPSRYPGSLRGA